MKLPLVTLVVLAVAASAARAQSIDEFVNQQMAQRHIPGLAVAVIRDGKVVVAKGFGKANVELDVPATENTVFQLASVTKQFTATAILLLVQDGKLALDDKVSARVPNLPAAWANVTIRQLLTHTSGVKNYTETKDFGKRSRYDFTQDEMLKLVADAPLDFPSGSKFNYSNTGYFLLGLVIEKASGKLYGEFVQQRIFQPLGMTATRFNDIHAIVKNRAAGYSWDGKVLQNADFASPTQPFSAGGLISTITDMIKWDAALNSDKILPKAVLESMWTATKLTDGSETGYGFGWGVQTKKGHRVISHSGGIDGFSTDIQRLVDDQVTVIVLANSDTAQAERISQGIAAIYVPAVAEEPKVAIEDKSPEVTAKLRAFLDRAVAGTVDREEFTAPAQTFFFPDRILQLKEFVGSLGAIRSFELIEEEVRGENRRRRYRVTGASGAALIGWVLAPDGKIVGIGINPE
ncbi:MAG: serine hydrolase domain-containing protein [Pyrinomonadaceae bacterium]